VEPDGEGGDEEEGEVDGVRGDAGEGEGVRARYCEKSDKAVFMSGSGLVVRRQLAEKSINAVQSCSSSPTPPPLNSVPDPSCSLAPSAAEESCAPFLRAMSSATTRSRLRPFRVRGREVARMVKERFSSGKDRVMGERPSASRTRSGEVERGREGEVREEVKKPSSVGS